MKDRRCIGFPSSELEWISEEAYGGFLAAARLEQRMDDEAVLSRMRCHECPGGSLVLTLRAVSGSTVYTVAPGRWGRIGKSSERPSNAVSFSREMDVAVKLPAGRKIHCEIARDNIPPRDDIRMLHKRLDSIMSAIPIFLQAERHLLHAALRALWFAGRRVSEAEVEIDSQARFDFIARAEEYTEHSRDEIWPRVVMRLTGGVDKRELMLAVPAELGEMGNGFFLHLVPQNGWRFKTSFTVRPDATPPVINPDEPF